MLLFRVPKAKLRPSFTVSRCTRRLLSTTRIPSSNQSARDFAKTEEPDPVVYRPDISWMGKKEEKEIDWLNLADVPDDAMPDPPDEETFKKERDYWAHLGEKEELPQAEAEVVDDTETPVWEIRNSPLATQRPEGLSDEDYEIKRHRYIQDFKKECSSTGNTDKIFAHFLNMRKAGFIPTAEMFSHAISIIVCYADDEAMELLLDEMKQLNYPHDIGVHNALCIQAMTNQDRELMEKRWKTMEDAGFEPSNQLCTLRLTFYGRYTDDWEACLNWWNEMIRRGHNDPNGGNMMLSFCNFNKLYKEADEVFETMKKNGFLEIKPKRDFIHSEGEEGNYVHVPRADAIQSTYLLMIEMCAEQLQVDRVQEFLDECQKNYTKWIRVQPEPDRWVPDAYFVEKVILCHIRTGQFETAMRAIMQMTTDGERPSEALMKEFFHAAYKAGNAEAVRQMQVEFDSWAYTYDEPLLQEALKMYFRLKDYRRVKNAWNQLLQYGLKPDAECRTALIQVYAEVGLPNEVQKFYDQQIQAGAQVNRTFHEIMLRDYLERGFPGSARIVARKMKEEGSPATQQEMEAIAMKYAELGGVDQLLKLIDREMVGEKASYVLSSVVISHLMKAFIHEDNIKDRALDAKFYWSKYIHQVVFEPATAEIVIRAFTTLREPDVALNAYTKLKQDYQFTSADQTTEVFEAVLSVPPSKITRLPERLLVFEDMKKAEIIPSIETYSAAMKLCSAHGSANNALRVMKDFVTQYYGIPYHRGFCIQFLTTMVRFDVGTYRQLCRAWLNRLVPPKVVETLGFMLPSRGNVDLTEFENSLLSITQSISLSKFISSLEFENLYSPESEEDTMTDLYQGSDIDVEDFLIHYEGYKPEKIHELFGVDPEYVKVKEKMDQLKRRKNALRNAEVGEGRVVFTDITDKE